MNTWDTSSILRSRSRHFKVDIFPILNDLLQELMFCPCGQHDLRSSYFLSWIRTAVADPAHSITTAGEEFKDVSVDR